MWWAQRFLDLAVLVKDQRDHVHASFLKALILQDVDPEQSLEIYLDLLAYVDHDLIRVIRNNLGVLYARNDDMLRALEQLQFASQQDPPLVAAVLNRRTILLGLRHARPRGPASPLIQDAESLPKMIQQVRAELREIASKEDLIEQLERRQIIPSEECAVLLRLDELPQSFGYPVATAERRVLARTCLQSARRALGREQWEEVRHWTERATLNDPYDPGVAQEAERLQRAAQRREAERKEQRSIEETRSRLQRVRALQEDGRLREALHEASALLSRSPGDESMQDLLEDLRQDLADAHMREAIANEVADPALARERLERVIRLKGGAEPEANVRIGLMDWPGIKERFLAVLEAKKYSEARGLARTLEGLAPSEDFRMESRRMLEELSKLEAEDLLEEAEKALDVGDLAQARTLASKAYSTSLATGPRVQSLLRAVVELEAASVKDKVNQLLRDGQLENARAELHEVSPEVSALPSVRTLFERVERRILADRDQQVTERLTKARFERRIHQFEKARQLVAEAKEIDPAAVSIAEESEQIQLAEELLEARKAVAADDRAGAVKLLVRLLPREGAAVALVDRLAGRESPGAETDGRGQLRTACELLAGRSISECVEVLSALIDERPGFETAKHVREEILRETNDRLQEADQRIKSGKLEAAESLLREVEARWNEEGVPTVVASRIDSLRGEGTRARTRSLPELVVREPGVLRRLWDRVVGIWRKG